MCACILRLNNFAKDNKTATPLVLSNQTKITWLMQHAGELSRLYSQSFVREIQGALRTRASFPSLRGARYTAKALTPYTLNMSIHGPFRCNSSFIPFHLPDQIVVVCW